FRESLDPSRHAREWKPDLQIRCPRSSHSTRTERKLRRLDEFHLRRSGHCPRHQQRRHDRRLLEWSRHRQQDRQTSTSGKKETPLYFLQDHLGSTTALTNKQGHLTEQITYDSYG